MNRSTTISTVWLLATVMGVASAQVADEVATDATPVVPVKEAEPVKPEQATLYLKNGDYVPGKFVAHDNDGQVRWQTNVFAEPAVFDLAGLEHVVYGKIAKPKPAKTTSTRQAANPIFGALSTLFKPSKNGVQATVKKPLVTTGSRVTTHQGTVLFGEILSLDDEWLAMRSERHGEFRIRRAAIERIDGTSGNLSMLFDAVSGFQGATSMGNGRAPTDWDVGGGSLKTEKRGANLYISTKHSGPTMIEAVLSSKSTLDFLVALGVSKNSNSIRSGFSVEMWEDRLVAHRQGGQELNHQELTTPTISEGTIRLNIFLHPEKGRLLVYSGAKLLGEFIDAEKKLTQKGFLIRNNGSALAIHRFQAKSWNGTTTPLAASDQHVVQLSEGKELQGEVQSISDGKLTFQAVDDEEAQEIELKTIDQIVFSSANEPSNDAPSDANLRVDYADGSVVTGKLNKTVDDGILVDVADVEKTLRLGWRRISRVQSLTKPNELKPEDSIGLIERTSHRLHGRVVQAGADGKILWLPVSSSHPVPLNLETRSKITFDSVTAAKIDPTLTDELHLINGDTVPCKLLAIDDESVHVRFSDGEEGKVRREVFKGIRRRPQASYIYRGFKDDETWHVGSNKRRAFSLKNGLLELKQSVFLSRDVQLPDRACISFDAQFTGDCILYVGFGADQSFEAVRRMPPNMGYNTKLMEAEAKRGRDFYAEVALTRTGKALTGRGYLRSSGLTGQAFMQNNMFVGMPQQNRAGSVPLTEDSPVNVDIFIDRKRKQFSIVANGKTLNSWKESARVDGSAIYIGFQSQQQNASMNFGPGATVKSAMSKPGFVKLSNLRVARWPGYMPDDRKERLLTRRLGARPKATTHVLRAFNGDSLRGRLVSIDNNTVTFQARLDTLTVPLDKVAEIISLQKIDSKKSKADPFSLELHDGGSIAMKPIQVTDDLMIGESPHIGRIAVPWKIISRLNVRNSFKRTLSNLASWSLLEPPALPDFVTNPGGGGSSSAPKSPMIGKAAPDLELKMLDGTKVSLEDLRGKVVVLDFWATWCGPCIASMPTMMEVTAGYKDKVEFIAVNQQEDADTVKGFLASRDWKELTVAMDDDTVASRTYRVEAIPHSVIIDAEGIVRQVHVGASPNLKDNLTKELDAILASKEEPSED